MPSPVFILSKRRASLRQGKGVKAQDNWRRMHRQFTGRHCPLPGSHWYAEWLKTGDRSIDESLPAWTFAGRLGSAVVSGTLKPRDVKSCQASLLREASISIGIVRVRTDVVRIARGHV
jgi:hypothetical protein